PTENIATLVLNGNKGDLRSLVASLNNVRPDILHLRSSNINDLATLLPVLSSVYTLSLGDNKISDLTPLKDVGGSATIQNIDLQFNPIQDITPITHLSELRSINFVAIPDSAIKPLEGLKFLESLDLSAPLEGERICPYKEKENICVWSQFRFDWSAAATE
ncbi:MAG: hypothetical protein M3Q07_26230, partial [Pseudobdellovibrionaceae bacterium]|nr:hypothetical protein [Pseudobdellovibrionaceae bacterium]